MLFFHNLLLAFTCTYLLLFASGQPTHQDEVESLRLIGRTLGKTDWNFSVDPCSGLSGWSTANPVKGKENAVTCDCTNATCHVLSIILKAQNLAGTLPQELIRLPFLREIDLSRNYLSGTIPPEWGSMKLVNISLLGNRITGPIPKELGNISTLAILTLDYNQLNGTIPPEFGALTQIERLVFTSNNLTGVIPDALGRLTTLRDFRISDNNFTGSIPTFIQNWKNIERLRIQGSGLTGPIPSGITSFIHLTDLRISDLGGNASTFPVLITYASIEYLILRSCNLVGQLPGNIGGMTTLIVLDLSFNKLSGPIPDTFGGLFDTDFIYLTGNSLSGPVPLWMLRNGAKNIDLSYNNLTTEGLEANCQPRYTNLFANSKDGASGMLSCLRNSQCDQEYYSLHINCGGGRLIDDQGMLYEDNSYDVGPSNFFHTTNWGFSSSGNFLDDGQRMDSFIVSTNSTVSSENSQLYKSARRSALSLTYYAFCLMNGSYTVNLHFAEIVFTNDSTYSSLGRRFFDVYIQGMRVMKDFNIEVEAGGVNRGIRKNFTAVVTDNTLDIRFYWAGKGTDGIPNRGVYGPLVSAISVDSDSPPSPAKNGGRISAGVIVGIVVGVLFIIFLVWGILWRKSYLGCKETMPHDLQGLDLHTGSSFSLRQIKSATNNFDPANKIGEGGFGPVYKGLLPNGTTIAVKQLSSKSKQGNREFVNEIGMISALQHPHLVKLHGCCIEGNQLLLVYEYMENNSLARALFGPEGNRLHLDWPTRHKICIGIARGLAYLHEESRLKIVHRDIKATNVLLDKNLVPKISDFGLAKLDEDDNTHISTRIAGTFGYMAPEYAMRGYLTDKADVYSFGIVVLEIVGGRSNASMKPKEAPFYLLDWAKSLNAKGNLMELVDPRLESNFNKEEVTRAMNVALLCTDSEATERPSMSAVVSMLEGEDGASEVVPDCVEMSAVHEEIVSMEVPFTASSTASDLYPIALDTEYWEKRDS